MKKSVCIHIQSAHQVFSTATLLLEKAKGSQMLDEWICLQSTFESLATILPSHMGSTLLSSSISSKTAPSPNSLLSRLKKYLQVQKSKTVIRLGCFNHQQFYCKMHLTWSRNILADITSKKNIYIYIKFQLIVSSSSAST